MARVHDHSRAMVELAVVAAGEGGFGGDGKETSSVGAADFFERSRGNVARVTAGVRRRQNRRSGSRGRCDSNYYSTSSAVGYGHRCSRKDARDTQQRILSRAIRNLNGIRLSRRLLVARRRVRSTCGTH